MSLIDELYDRVEEARYYRVEFVEITRAEHEKLKEYLTHEANPPLPPDQGIIWGFPARIVDELSHVGADGLTDDQRAALDKHYSDHATAPQFRPPTRPQIASLRARLDKH